jgi:hypothetical protein
MQLGVNPTPGVQTLDLPTHLLQLRSGLRSLLRTKLGSGEISRSSAVTISAYHEQPMHPACTAAAAAEAS